MKRRLFNLLAGLSLLVFVTVCVLWVRSYRAPASIYGDLKDHRGRCTGEILVASGDGLICIELHRLQNPFYFMHIRPIAYCTGNWVPYIPIGTTLGFGGYYLADSEVWMNGRGFRYEDIHPEEALCYPITIRPALPGYCVRAIFPYWLLLSVFLVLPLVQGRLLWRAIGRRG